MAAAFKNRLLIGFVLAALLIAPAFDARAQVAAPANRNTHEMLDAVLWIQTSTEYRFLCEGVYASARDGLDKALADPTWTAALEQTGDFSKLPPAVILDIDETVLEHSGYQAELVRRGISPASRTWRDFVAKYRVPPVPGALEYVKYARSRGITVFFVTNREVELKEYTRRNLAQLGVDLPASPDTLLVAGEQPGWTSDKSSRRAFIARTHRILMLFGDDFGDFLSGAGNSPDRRYELAGAHREMWGRRWFLLPNPLTGSWISALARNVAPMTETQALDFLRSMVRGYDAMNVLAP